MGRLGADMPRNGTSAATAMPSQLMVSIPDVNLATTGRFPFMDRRLTVVLWESRV